MISYNCNVFFLEKNKKTKLPNVVLLHYKDVEKMLIIAQNSHPHRLLKIKIYKILNEENIIKISYFYTSATFSFFSNNSYDEEEIAALTREQNL
jgi:hypothetical protein